MSDEIRQGFAPDEVFDRASSILHQGKRGIVVVIDDERAIDHANDVGCFQVAHALSMHVTDIIRYGLQGGDPT